MISVVIRVAFCGDIEGCELLGDLAIVIAVHNDAVILRLVDVLESDHGIVVWLCRGTAIDVVLQLVQVAAGHGPNDVEDFLFVWGRHVDVVKGHLTLIDAGAEEGRALEELLLVRQLSTRACKQVVGDHLLNPEVVDVARIVKGQLFVVRRVVLLGRVALNLGQVQVLNLGVDFVLDGLGLRRLLGDVQ